MLLLFRAADSGNNPAELPTVLLAIPPKNMSAKILSGARPTGQKRRGKFPFTLALTVSYTYSESY